MYSIIKNVIASRRYELGDMLGKIDAIWLQGDLTDEQKSELVELARDNADPAASYAPLQEQIDHAFAQIKALGDRVAKLEAGETPEPAPEPGETVFRLQFDEKSSEYRIRIDWKPELPLSAKHAQKTEAK